MLNLYPCFRHYHDYNTVWLYSDPHFGDEEIFSLRGYRVTDEEQVKRINSKVGKKDIIIFLGDIGDPSYIKKIKGYKVLVTGNHDKGSTVYEKRDDNPFMFDEVYNGVLALNEKILLSHEPVSLQFMFNIHGHDHSNKVSIDDGMHLNVCAEHIDYTPISLNSLVKKGLFKNVPNIHRLAIDRANDKKDRLKTRDGKQLFSYDFWENTFNHTCRWILRRMSPESLSLYGDTIEDWQYINDKFLKLENELYGETDGHKIVVINDYFDICNKYIHQAKEDNRSHAIAFFFSLYKDYPTDYVHFTDYFKPATKQEIKRARKDFGIVKENDHGKISEHKHTFSDDAKVLDYRGLRLIIDNEWGNAWIKDEGGVVRSFQLIWDWDYPIDEYIAYHII